MNMYDIIKKKRDGESLSLEEIDYVVSAYTKQRIPDYQVSALLMAIFIKGMTDEECSQLTLAMAESGDVIDLSSIHGVKVDKHSTGGVGDSVTLALAPLVASLGVPVAKMSGRGLGHTGGTLDKLGAIPSLTTNLTNEQFIQNVNKYKLAIIGQTKNIAPADALLYSLRDVTATVDSIPLIASSIMSKKIASGADAIVLDVKVGSGAFMKTEAEARQLAEVMVSIGAKLNKETNVIISQMNQPLGFAVGNTLEIRETIDLLNNKGPDDLKNLCIELGSHMLLLAKKSPTIAEARTLLQDQIKTGAGLNTFKQFILAQGGNPNIVDEPDLLPIAKETFDVDAEQAGYVSAIDTTKIGTIAMNLGAGRKTKNDPIDLGVGLILRKKIGDYVDSNEPLVTVYTNGRMDRELVRQLIVQSYTFTDSPVQKPPLILDIIQ